MIFLELVPHDELTIRHKGSGINESMQDVIEKFHNVLQKSLGKESLGAPFGKLFN